MCSDHDHDFLYPVVGEGVLRRKRERLSSGVLKIEACCMGLLEIYERRWSGQGGGLAAV